MHAVALHQITCFHSFNSWLHVSGLAGPEKSVLPVNKAWGAFPRGAKGENGIDAICAFAPDSPSDQVALSPASSAFAAAIFRRVSRMVDQAPYTIRAARKIHTHSGISCPKTAR